MGIFRGLSPKNLEFWGCFGDRESPNFGDEDGDRALQNLGTFWGRGQPKYWGFLGVNPRKPPNFGDGDGVTAPKMFGDALGTGKPQTLGIFGEKSPKIPNFWDRDGGKNLGDFYHSLPTLYNNDSYELF